MRDLRRTPAHRDKTAMNRALLLKKQNHTARLMTGTQAWDE
ncbi:MAG: hypothetical protein ABSE55_13000 [Terracidiphilus sp.]|jgi:hypothetical protein